MYLFRLPHPDGSSYSVVGSSPEALVRVTGERAITHPIAGSRPRGKTPEDDVRLAEELLADPKERSEHVMLVDLGRNDLQRVCRPGTVDVVEFMDVRRYSHVMHIESTVVGDTRPGVSAYDVLVSTFPAGTLSGAPKPRALALIEQYEPSRRGVYGGVVGYLDFHGDLDMAIAIRTARHQGRRRPRAGRRRHRRRLGAGPRVRGVRAQGDRGAARGRDRRGDADRHVRRLSSKGVVVLLALVGAGLLLVSAFRPWVTGAVDDAVLGATRISATGAEVAPGLSAVALAIAAAAIAIVAAGRIARVVAVVAYALCVAVAAALAVRVLLDPEGVLGPVAASRVGRTGSVETVADPTIWPWVALLACAVALLGLVGAVVGMRRWGGPSQRYEVPDGTTRRWRPGRAASGSRATGTSSAPDVTRPMWVPDAPT